MATRISAAGLISELIVAVSLALATGELRDVPAADMEFGYDTSRLQRTGEIVVAADFAVSPGDPEQLRATARESLAFRKRTQPLDLAQRRLHLPESRSRARCRSGRNSAGRPARWSIEPG